MSCNCSSNLYKSQAAAANNTDASAVLITPTNALAPSNMDKVSLLITSIGTVTPTLPVYVVLNGGTIPVLDKYGNIVYGANLRTRICLRGYYGTNGNATTATHLQLVNFPFSR